LASIVSEFIWSGRLRVIVVTAPARLESTEEDMARSLADRTDGLAKAAILTPPALTPPPARVKIAAMVRELESYALGKWQAPGAGAGEAVTVADANTGEAVATVSSAGIDAAAMAAFARGTGGAAIRGMTFHERGQVLKALAGYLNERREAYYEDSFRTGATLGDSRFDVDGGIGVLFAYASRARRELPNDTILVDGGAEALGRQGTFVGQHIFVPRPGVAVQINAFNFPVWGMLEKFAPAFLAGMPSIAKPATQTAYLTETVVRDIVASGLLPEGALQLLCGQATGLLDALGEHDVVAFTGSAATARRLRTHPVIVERSVRFNAEADSLNCSILGPDVSTGDPEFGLYVDQLVTEMTVKAGQKCTAIRRAFVPRELVADVVEAAAAKLGDVRIGNAGDPDTTMGPLASLAQRDEVLRSLKALRDAAEVAVGNPDDFDAWGDKERGAFLPPLLLRCEDPNRPAPHEVEAFGPVSTLMGYGDLDEAVSLAARGRGSLAGSIVTHDTDVARRLVLGLAPWHGRLLVLDSRDAAESTGHGSPLPGLVHGGPGRAGGGEEMGGLRGLHHHMQRLAVQATPDVVSAVTGRYVTGAAKTPAEAHPFRKYLEDLQIGESITVGPRKITIEDINTFAELTGDTFYAHTDAEAAAKNPFFGGIVAHGYLVLSYAAGLFVDPAPGPVLANYGLDGLRFLTPTFPGDEISVSLTVKQVTPRDGADYGEVAWEAVVSNQEGKTAATYDILTMVAKRPA
jgi:oxepin-CoA hydrolase/3-oxo-5,6-dehydrosuberyl-CoA semialdehyde dehydrogenase